MVINVLVGYAIKKDRLLHFYPDNASITEIEVENRKNLCDLDEGC